MPSPAASAAPKSAPVSSAGASSMDRDVVMAEAKSAEVKQPASIAPASASASAASAASESSRPVSRLVAMNHHGGHWLGPVLDFLGAQAGYGHPGGRVSHGGFSYPSAFQFMRQQFERDRQNDYMGEREIRESIERRRRGAGSSSVDDARGGHGGGHKRKYRGIGTSGFLGGPSTSVPPNPLTDHIHLHTRQYFKFLRSYLSDWYQVNPFKTSAYDSFWAKDSTTANPYAFWMMAMSFRWRWDPTGALGPRITLGAPDSTSYLTDAVTYTVPFWGEAVKDVAMLSQFLRYWNVTRVGIEVERLPRATPTIGMISPDGVDYPNQGIPTEALLDVGQFFLAPWCGEPLKADYTTGRPDFANLVGGTPAVDGELATTARFGQVLLDSAVFPHKKVYSRLNDKGRIDSLEMTVKPTNPILVASNTADSAVSLQGYEPGGPVDVYDWAAHNVYPKGFFGFLGWQVPNYNQTFYAQMAGGAAQQLTTDELSKMVFRIRFRMEVHGFGALPYTGAEALSPTDSDPEVKAAIADMCEGGSHNVERLAVAYQRRKSAMLASQASSVRAAAVATGQLAAHVSAPPPSPSAGLESDFEELSTGDGLAPPTPPKRQR